MPPHHPEPCRSHRSGLRPPSAGRDHEHTHARTEYEVEWNLQLRSKLDMDWRALLPLCVAMDEDTRDLISRLGTRIGMIMEDTNVTALTLGRMELQELGPAIDTLVKAGARISIFVAALKELMD